MCVELIDLAILTLVFCPPPLAECQRMKAQVVQEIRSNQQLEQDLHIMDIKIGLLVKNRITLEDVVSHSSQIKKERRRGTVPTATGEGGVTTTGLGGLTKANQQQLEVRMCVCVCVCVFVVICITADR